MLGVVALISSSVSNLVVFDKIEYLSNVFFDLLALGEFNIALDTSSGFGYNSSNIDNCPFGVDSLFIGEHFASNSTDTQEIGLPKPPIL